MAFRVAHATAARRGGEHCPASSPLLRVPRSRLLKPRELSPPTRTFLAPSQILSVRSVREIDRERMGLERQEKKLIVDIKKAAKDGQLDSAKVMAKDLVRTRGYVKKM